VYYQRMDGGRFRIFKVTRSSRELKRALRVLESAGMKIPRRKQHGLIARALRIFNNGTGRLFDAQETPQQLFVKSRNAIIAHEDQRHTPSI